LTTIENPTRRALRSAAAAIALSLGLLGTDAAAQTDVQVTQPQRRHLELATTQPGTAEAFYEADLGAKVSGYVGELLVDIGERVKTGQVLARITVPELIQARNAAAADVAANESEYERIAMLAERNSVTQKVLSEAKNRLETARAKRAEVEAEMAYATIESPFDGFVTSRTIDPGDMVYQASSPKGGDQALLRVAKVDVIRVKTYIPERESAWVDVGDPATVVFGALAGKVFMGQVARTAQALDPATRTLLVEIDLPNTDGRIRPGYYGQAHLVLETRDNALAVPSESLRFEGGKPFVYTVEPGGAARRTPIEIGLRTDEWAEVASGLTGSERIVTRAAGGLTDGAAVRVAAQ
jgi:RND family efflux transporter MFP subunit